VIAPLEQSDEVIRATRRWLERAVIGLQLCPFAAGPYAGGRVRFRVSEQSTGGGLLRELRDELGWLAAQSADQCETTLLIHPLAFSDFLAYNDFLSDCEAALLVSGLEGTLQIASFHPQYQFAGTAPGDVENYTNRSPYPMLHLLREESIERAVANLADPEEIYRRNIRTLRALGLAGWRGLWEGGA
jgi:hypothetical protein